jgi:hypothetical protein
MIGILRSPRKRRRLAYSVLVPLTLATVVMTAAKLLPEAKEDPPEVFSDRQAYNVAAHEKPARLTRTVCRWANCRRNFFRPDLRSLQIRKQ